MDGITGVLLAGGQATRMGGHDKGLLLYAGEALIAHGVRSLLPQVAELLISANRNQERYAAFGCRVIGDAPEFQRRGPLAGILAAMDAASTPYILSAPCDAPYLPPDYAQHMWAALAEAGATASVAVSVDSWQPVFALLPVRLREDLAVYLASTAGGVGRWLRSLQPATVAFPDCPEMFTNLNTPEQLAEAVHLGKTQP